MNPETLQKIFFVICGIMLILSFFLPPPTDTEINEAREKEENEFHEYQRRWKNMQQRNNTIRYDKDYSSQSKPEPEPESSMQKFHRENTFNECIKRGGTLTTGEAMEALYGASEEIEYFFPDRYRGEQEDEQKE
jgi:hypothetical protein